MRWKPSEYLPEHPAYDIKQHVVNVQRLHAEYPLNTKEKCEQHLLSLLKPFFQVRPPWQIAEPLINTLRQLYTDNDFFIIHPPTMEYTPYLTQMQGLLSDQERIKRADDATKQFLYQLKTMLPVLGDHGLCTVSVLQILPHPRHLSSLVHHHFSIEYNGQRLFPKLMKAMNDNAIRASGHDPRTYERGKIIAVQDASGTPEEIVSRYLADTLNRPGFVGGSRS